MIDAAVDITFSEWLVVAWMLCNIVSGVCFLHIAWEIRYWVAHTPRKGTGFRALAMLFQIVLCFVAMHFLSTVIHIWDRNIPNYLIGLDAVLASITLVTSLTLHIARHLIADAFSSMMRHHDEWDGQ